MSDFQLWFQTGLEHILDLQGYDHILYIIALCIPFPLKAWTRLLWLVTAFTIGHSLTLALSVSGLIQMPQSVVEIWIALTILISCIWNLKDGQQEEKHYRSRYAAAAVFGCIHGLGFSYLLKSMLGHTGFLFPLLCFNLGLETGQLVILLVIVLCKYLLQIFWPGIQNIFTTTITFVILLLSGYMLISRLYLLI
jgi:hydrogenase/urease accessory protein HupE